MLIVIVSDIHDNLPNLKKCLNWCQNNKIEKIIFCGDATTIETIDYLASEFSGQIFITNGNAEIYSNSELQRYKNIGYYQEIGIIKIANLNIGFCHQLEKINLILKAKKNDLDFIFYGHTHRPTLKKNKNTIIANPGNLAGSGYQASFATLNTDNKKLELKILAILK